MVFVFERGAFSQPDPTLLKLRELASTSQLNLGKNSSQAPEGLLDNSIDQDNYFIGGGDVFSSHIVELPSVEYVVMVDQNCDAVISDLGIIRLGKKSLTQAKKIIGDFIRSKLKKPYDVYVSLVRSKTAIVTVSGAITNPGTYQVGGTFRLFDVIRIANNHILPSVADFDYREVKCIRKDTTEYYDLLKFLLAGDNSQNPYVYPGDNIVFDMTDKRVFISGSLRTPYLGYVPIKSNETVKDFLSLFNFDGSADSGQILVMKYGGNSEAQTVVFSLREPKNMRLDDRDVILVQPKSDYPRLQIIQVSGEINRPGTYPIQSRKTNAQSIIELAGGPTIRGNLKRAFIIRRNKIEGLESAMIPQTTTPMGVTSAQHPASSVVRPEIAAALSNVTSSKDYSIIPIRDNAKQMLLEPNDELVIPKIENVVYLSGNVKAPGAYPFVEGKEIPYYVEHAGGLTTKGDKSNIFSMIQYGDVYQMKSNLSVEEGDVIVIPESQQYKFLTTVLLPVISVFLTALSVALMTYSVTNSKN